MTDLAQEEYERRGNDVLREQLAMLDRQENRRLRDRLTLLEVRCRRCGDTPFVVVATRPYQVVRTWRTSLAGGPARPKPPQAGFTPAEMADYARGFARPSRRRDTRAFVPLARDADHPVPAERRRVASACRCQEVTRSEAWIFARLDEAAVDPTLRRITIAGPLRSSELS